ncbi:hypothetical protein NC653_041973 [Populus alba x Populus x berolinensis]|uniref:ADP-ribosylation factor n=1 Tax=Populus alba x Populus x berolinensis TaxID=444605 RepID=A0AAD6L9U8_9ROSI|nr:hypothetical protein NC653_041973 [Populus alba x Populus x berolinensis]
MGQAFRKLFDTFFGNTEMRVVMLGLDAAGKTTILYKLHIGEVLSTVPTIGFNVEKVQYKNVVFTVWDVGGQEKLRPLWRHYFNNTDGLIYVVDSLDRERIGRAKAEFQTIVKDPFMLNSIILVFANKQDMIVSSNYAFSDLLLMSCIKALTSHVLAEEFLALRFWNFRNLQERSNDPNGSMRRTRSFSNSRTENGTYRGLALSGEMDLYEGLDWLSGTFKEMRAAGYSSVGTSSF